MDRELYQPARVTSGAITSSGIPFRIDGSGRVNVNAMRPFLGAEGETRVITTNGSQVLNTNDGLLRYQEWLDIDRTVIETTARRLVGIADLQARGLVHSLGSIGQTVTMWERSSDMTKADVNMSGVTKGEEDTPAYSTQMVPVPIVHKDFRLNLRRLEASRMFGESVDVTAAAIAARLVAEASELMLFSGVPITVDEGTIYGYRNFPGRAQLDLAKAWTAATPEEILADVQAMLAAARANRFFGPFTIYIPPQYEGILDEDYYLGDLEQGVVASVGTIRDRLLALSGIERIVVADFLLTADGGAVNDVVLVQLDREVVDLAVAQDVTTLSWQAMGGMQEMFKVMAVWVPRIKSDYDGRCGIVHLRPA